MAKTLVPTSVPGKVSMWLIAAFFGMFIVMQAFVTAGQQGGDTLFDNLYLSVPAIIGGCAALGAFFSGAFAIIWRKERSVLTIGGTLIGLIVLMFVVGELAVPH